MTKNTIFTQLTHFISPFKFQKISQKLGNEKYVKKLDGYSHFKILLLAHIKGFSSLRSIETGLKSRAARLYHLGINLVLKRSTLADANSKRDPLVLQEAFYNILTKCKSVSPKHKFKFSNDFYSLDASVISLSLTLFPWGKHRKHRSAVKINTLLNHSGNIPEFISVTPGSHHEIRATRGKYFPKLPKGSIVAADRGYIDFKWFQKLEDSNAFFITRTKKRFDYKVVSRNKVVPGNGIKKDHVIKLNGVFVKKDYPGKLRLIKYHDAETGKTFEYLTNNFQLSARTIADCYKERWQIEMFFKWIKQNLKIKRFMGNNIRAVQFQIWAAMIYYLMLSYLKFLSKWNYSLLEITRTIREKIEDRIPISALFEIQREQKRKPKLSPDQTELFKPILTGH